MSKSMTEIINDSRRDMSDIDEYNNSTDPKKIIRTRLGNTYKTHAGYIADMLANGVGLGFSSEVELKRYIPSMPNALAKDMSTRKIWRWDGSGWADTGKSDVDVANDFTKDSLDSSLGGIVLQGSIKENRGLNGGLNQNNTAIIETAGGICIEFQAEPNTTYSFIKNESTRSRIAEFPMNPPAAGAGNMIYSGQDRTFPDSRIQEEIKITTSATAKSIIVYVSNKNEEVNLRALKANNAELKTSVEITSPSLRITQNVCQNVVLTDRYFAGPGRVDVIATFDKIQLIVQPVEPNTTYTLSKKGGNRFRVALSQTYAIIGNKVNCIYIQDDLRYMPQSYTFTTESDTRFAMFMLSNNTSDLAYDIQLEKGAIATEFKPYGVAFKELIEPLPVGDARFFNNTGWFKNEALTIPATDDTLELQRLINIGGYVSLDPNRVYYITGTVTIDTRKVKYFNGMNALIVVKGDIDGVLIRGGHNSISHPTNVGRNVYWDKDGVVTGLRCVPAIKGQGNGVVIEQCIGLRFFGNAASLFKKGLSLRKYTRDLIIHSNQIWSNDECNLYMDSTCNLHQSLIFGNVMTYAKYCIWYDGCEIFNQAVTNNILETAENPIFDADNVRIPEAIIYMDANGKTLGGINIECNGIEDHAISARNIKMIAQNGGQLVNVTVNSGLATSSKGSEIEFGALDDRSAVSGITFSGFTSNSTAGSALIKQIGHVGKVKINSINYTGSRLYECDGEFTIGQLTINDCESSGGSSFPNILINARSADVIKIKNNTLAVSGLVTYTSVVSVNLLSEDVNSRLVTISNNDFVAAANVPANKKLIEIKGSVSKSFIRDNVSNLENPQYISEVVGKSVIDMNY